MLCTKTVMLILDVKYICLAFMQYLDTSSSVWYFTNITRNSQTKHAIHDDA